MLVALEIFSCSLNKNAFEMWWSVWTIKMSYSTSIEALTGQLLIKQCSPYWMRVPWLYLQEVATCISWCYEGQQLTFPSSSSHPISLIKQQLLRETLVSIKTNTDLFHKLSTTVNAKLCLPWRRAGTRPWGGTPDCTTGWRRTGHGWTDSATWYSTTPSLP